MPSPTRSHAAVDCFERLEPRTLLAADLPALADAYVRDGSSASANFGSAAELVVKRSVNTGNSREAYLRFNIAGASFAAGQTVKLRLYGALSDTRDPSVALALHPVSNTSWDESAVTWNTRPAVGAALQTTTVTGTTDQWYEWDVTNYVVDEKTNGQTDVAFALRSVSAHDPLVVFNAEEGSANDPVLSVSDGTTPPPPPTGQTPYNGAPFAIGATPVTIQAEDYDLGGEGIAYHDIDAKNDGGQYRSDGVDIMSHGTGFYRIGGPKAGEWLEYTIEVEQAGGYELEFRVGQSEAGARFHAEVDGVNLTGSLMTPDTGSFNSFASVKNTVTLTAGQHVLRLAQDANAVNGYAAGLDWVKISPAALEPGQTPFRGAPFAIGAGSVTIQAEDYDLGGEGIAYHDTDAKNDGGQYRSGDGVDIMSYGTNLYRIGGPKAGEWLEYTMDVAQAGDYELEFRVSQSAAGASFHAEIDGVNVTGSLAAPDTNGFSTFTTVTKTVTLSAGQHVLRFAQDANAANGYAAGLDWMKVAPSGRAVTVAVDLGDVVQTVEGFGSAMISWIPRNPDAPLRTEYEDPAFYDKIVGDLGASMARIPIWPTFEIVNDNNDPNTFNWDGFSPAALGRTLTFLQRLKDRGVTKFMATVWTPPQWMKTNGAAYEGGMLRPDLRDEFAEYIAAFAIVARDQFGISMSGISIQNEPLFVQNYESMIVTPEQFREVVRTVRAKLDREGLAAVKILMPEDVNSSDRFSWYVAPTLNDPETRDAVDVLATHGTQTDHWAKMGPLIDQYRADYDKPFWLTEASGHAANWTGAMVLGTAIYDAVVRGDASAYLYWQWSESAGQSQYSLMIDGQPTAKYHVAKHFYRYVRPGAVRVGATSSDAGLKVASFKHPTSGAVTHVLINTATTAANVILDLSDAAGAVGAYKQYRTSSGESHVRLTDIAGGAAAVRVNLPASSIVTLYSGPDLAGGAATSGGPLPAVQRIDTAPFAAYDAELSSALRTAAMKGQLATVQSLIVGGADVNAASDAGWTALHAAAAGPYVGSVAVINELLRAGAQLASVTDDGWTPLHVAAANGTTANGTSSTLARDKVNALLPGGASSLINARDGDGRTALHWAAFVTKLNLGSRTEDATVVNALLAGGADKTLLDRFGKSARDYALSEGNGAAATALA